MKLGILSAAEPGASDRLLGEVVAVRMARGEPVIAMVRAPGEDGLVLQLWPGGEIRSIAQDLGSGASGCTLDPAALAEAVEATRIALEAAPPGTPLVINKFGKTECAGGGARPLIAQALMAGHPVILGVPRQTRADFETFSDGLHQEIAFEMQAIDRFFATEP